MIYIEETAKQLLEANLADGKANYCKGYFMEDNEWIAFDNSIGECYVEEFDTESKAICWLENYFEISDSDEFKIQTLSKDLYFIPSAGYLKVEFNQNTISTKLYLV